MTKEERKKFFEYRDRSGDTASINPNDGEEAKKGKEGGLFKDANAFFDYLSKSVTAFNTPTKIQDFKDNLKKRGLVIDVDESQFLVHIEATVHQTKKTMEAVVEQVPETQPSLNAPPTMETQIKRSSLKVMQMRFL